MDWKKAKTILLLVLLCTNLFMVCNLAWQVSRVKGQQRQAMNEALSLLRQEVGDFDEDLFRDLGTQPAVYRFERDRQKEEQIAQALLGDGQREDEGGGITQFRSQAGQLEFRSGGVVELTLERQPEGEGAAFYRDLLAEAGFPMEGAQADTAGGQVELTQRLPNGHLAANCVLVCQQEQGRIHIKGHWLLHTDGTKAGEGRRSYQLVMDLRAYLLQEGVSDPPEQAELIYRLRNTGDTGSLLAEPFWSVTAGGKEYTLSAVTGQALQNVEIA